MWCKKQPQADADRKPHADAGHKPRADAEHKPRADARRNRLRLLDAARTVFVARGPQASLDEIARLAGVGIGTLYRHFPTREALIAELYAHASAELGDAAERLAAEAEPLAALRDWLDLFIDYLDTKRLMGAVLDTMGADAAELRAASGARVKAAIGLLAARAEAAGAIRLDSEPVDLLRALVAVMPEHDGQKEPQQGAARARQMARILLAGLAAGAGRNSSR